MNRFASFIVIMILPLLAKTQTADSIKIRGIITLDVTSENTLVEHWKPGLREVEFNRPPKYLVIPRQALVLTQIASDSIEVRLSKPFRFRSYSGGMAHDQKLESFMLKGQATEISKIMTITEGTFVTNPDTNFERVQEFIEVMKNPGMPKEVFQFVQERWSPMSIYQLNGLNLDVPLERVMEGLPIEIRRLDYRGDVVVSNVFRHADARDIFPRGLEQVGPFLDMDSELVRDYRAAHTRLIDRIATLKFRGWWPRFELEPLKQQSSEGLEFVKIENVEPLAAKCSRIFE